MPLSDLGQNSFHTLGLHKVHHHWPKTKADFTDQVYIQYTMPDLEQRPFHTPGLHKGGFHSVFHQALPDMICVQSNNQCSCFDTFQNNQCSCFDTFQNNQCSCFDTFQICFSACEKQTIICLASHKGATLKQTKPSWTGVTSALLWPCGTNTGHDTNLALAMWDQHRANILKRKEKKAQLSK